MNRKLRAVMLVMGLGFIILGDAVRASAQTVSTNMPSISDVTGYVGVAVGLAAAAVTGSIVIAVGWKAYRAFRKTKV